MPDSKPRTVKVRISFTLEVNADDWAETYNMGSSTQEVTEDVRSYFDAANLIPPHLAQIVRAV